MTVFTELFDTAAANAVLQGTNNSPTDNTVFSFTVPTTGTATTRPSKNTINGLSGHGSMLLPAGAAGVISAGGWSGSTFTKFKLRFYIYVTVLPTTDTYLVSASVSGTRKASLHLNSAGKLRLSDSTGTAPGVATDANTIPLNSLHYIDIYGDLGTSSAGTLKFALTRASDDVVIYQTSLTAGAQNLGTSAFDTIQVGRANASAYATDFWISAVTFDNAPTDTSYLGKYIVPGSSTAVIATVNSSTGWTPTGGTVQAVLADSNDATGITSSDNPSAILFDGTLGALLAPSGNFTVRVRCNKLNASSGTFVPKLYAADGTTLISTASTITIPDAFGAVDCIFLAASLTGVTQAQWTAGLRFKLTTTAA